MICYCCTFDWGITYCLIYVVDMIAWLKWHGKTAPPLRRSQAWGFGRLSAIAGNLQYWQYFGWLRGEIAGLRIWKIGCDRRVSPMMSSIMEDWGKGDRRLKNLEDWCDRRISPIMSSIMEDWEKGDRRFEDLEDWCDRRASPIMSSSLKDWGKGDRSRLF